MNLIEIGEVVNTHGVRGEIKLNPWTDNPNALCKTKTFYYKDGDAFLPLRVRQVRIHKNCAIIQAEDIQDMQTAEGFRGRILYAERDVLPAGRYYIADLLGLLVVTESGPLGTVTDVFSTGANDVYEVKAEGQPPIYLPAIQQVVKEINIEEGYMKVEVPAGLLD